MTPSPNVDPEEISRFEETAEHWWDPEGPYRALHDINPIRLHYIEQQVGGLAGQRVLDVGCGGGLLSEGMAIRGAHTLGIDMSLTAIAVAKAHAEHQAAAQLTYLHTDLAQLEEPPFDVVTCLEMLEHVPDPSAILMQMAQQLKPGGHLIVSTINRNLMSYLGAVVMAEYLLNLVPRGTHDYQRFIQPAELAHWAHLAGFKLQHQSALSYDPFTRRARLSSRPTINYLMHFTLETL
jgi:2-polyprenyl-6-hydroxyphenyl methylase/3-demethylubiquinone-9 3-methyltransferase